MHLSLRQTIIKFSSDEMEKEFISLKNVLNTYQFSKCGMQPMAATYHFPPGVGSLLMHNFALPCLPVKLQFGGAGQLLRLIVPFL
jgi:hypothetical protein